MSDYNYLMESRLSAEQYQLVTELSRIAAEQGLNLYLVGGAVRDLTYGQQVIRDLDFAVEGNPEKILRRLESRRAAPVRPGRAPTGGAETSRLQVESIHFDSRQNAGTIRCAGGTQAELVMCQQEMFTKDGRRAALAPAMIFDDLKRRDFSVNAMAISLHPNSRGLLLDPTNGAADIEAHELRALHGRGLSEDPSRIYRLLRLGLRLGFKPEPRTQAWLESTLQNRPWEQLDPAHQGRELHAILAEENPGRFLRMFAGRNLLAGLDKKLASARIPYDRFNKIQSVARTVPGADPVLLNFHCLVQGLGSGDRMRLAKKILADKKAMKTALSLDRDARILARVLASSKAGLQSYVYAMLSSQPLILLLFLLANYPQQKIKSRIKNYLFKAPQIRANLPRAELQAMGVKPGPEFDRILERLFLDQLDGKIKTHQQALKRLKELAGIEPVPEKAKETTSEHHGKKKK
jgi:tRNA nucleotidyltransferase/poly(A) polymerase